ncbi:MAG: hypothetical protein ACI9XO_003107 [Paraglaciecola sp.]|jgi:hypothetical protein
MTFSEIIGAIGVTILLIGYLLNINGKLASNNAVYMLMNVVGSGMAFCSSYLIDFVPFMVLEGIWTGISAYSFGRIMWRKA